MNLQKRSFNREERAVFYTVLKEVSKDSRFPQCSNYIQHGKTTVRKHCIRVAATAYYLALKTGIQVNHKELIRGALLHDYFLYDWHEKTLKNQIHGFTHGRTALKEASADFTLSKREQNMILHHMFPLTPCPPLYREGWFLCLADKICATGETIRRK